MNKKLIEKFIRGKCSSEEELKVIEWLREENYEAALEKMITEDLQEAYESGSPEQKDLSHIRDEILKKYAISAQRKDQTAFLPQPLLRIAASIAVLIAVGVGVFHFTNESSKGEPNKEAISQVVKSNSRGRKSTISLGDGTTIYLNSESKITYPNKFPDSVRVIQLEGEAFFEVAKDERRPFIVKTNYLDLKVLGTSFNVKTFSDSEEVTIALATGKVEITDIGNSKEAAESVMLNPGQAVIFNKTERAFGEISNFDPNYEYGWKNGLIFFNKASLEEVIEKLERWYDVNIIVINKPPNKWVYKAYHKNESLELVLQSMAHNEAFDFEINDKVVTIKFK